MWHHTHRQTRPFVFSFYYYYFSLRHMCTHDPTHFSIPRLPCPWTARKSISQLIQRCPSTCFIICSLSVHDTTWVKKNDFKWLTLWPPPFPSVCRILGIIVARLLYCNQGPDLGRILLYRTCPAFGYKTIFLSCKCEGRGASEIKGFFCLFVLLQEEIHGKHPTALKCAWELAEDQKSRPGKLQSRNRN